MRDENDPRGGAVRWLFIALVVAVALVWWLT